MAAPRDQLADRAVAEGRIGVGDRLDQELAGCATWPTSRFGERPAGTPTNGDRGVRGVLLDPDDRFEQEGQDLLAIDTRQCQGDLGLDDAELDSQVEPGAHGFPVRDTAPAGRAG